MSAGTGVQRGDLPASHGSRGSSCLEFEDEGNSLRCCSMEFDVPEAGVPKLGGFPAWYGQEIIYYDYTMHTAKGR